MRSIVSIGSLYFQLRAYFFYLNFLKKIKKSVCSFFDLALPIINLRIIPKKLLSSPNLFKAQVLYIYKALEIVIVRKYKNLMFTAF